jgi:hypothetical protein
MAARQWWLMFVLWLAASFVLLAQEGAMGTYPPKGAESMTGPGDGSTLIVTGVVKQIHNYDAGGMETFELAAGPRGPITVLVPGASDVAAYLRRHEAERIAIELRGRE